MNFTSYPSEAKQLLQQERWDYVQNFEGQDVWVFFYTLGVYKTHLHRTAPFDVCYSIVIISSVLFHSEKYLSLYDGL